MDRLAAVLKEEPPAPAGKQDTSGGPALGEAPAEDDPVAKGSKDCGNCGRTYHSDSKQRSCEDCGHKLPLADSDNGKAADDETDKGQMACSKCGMKGHGEGARCCAKCGTKLAGADGGSDGAEKGATPGDGVQGKKTQPVPAHREPDGPQAEVFEQSAHMEDGDAKTEGTGEATPTWGKALDYGLGRLHDALCAAYSLGRGIEVSAGELLGVALIAATGGRSWLLLAKVERQTFDAERYGESSSTSLGSRARCGRGKQGRGASAWKAPRPVGCGGRVLV
ncbi:hypothetical protein [Actinoallomurus rhizosphaericola]|uniref:hypothetical protein n=1 Tax=Actinoallomurus rhizosphaericola TaxID=2952536 RepID=UPI0020936CA3|nr:hypothetical protein [Actinoallomurus rhizosphaericola]MCO5999790.1 hypothetical protein [Actinoallomurus rhizosphaericola]